MQKYNFNHPLKDLDGKEIEGGNATTLGRIASDVLGQMMDPKLDVVKIFSWAMTIRNEGVIQLDESSVKQLKEIFGSREGMMLFVRYQLVKVLENPVVEAVGPMVPMINKD